jgi:hypothetical protein
MLFVLQFCEVDSDHRSTRRFSQIWLQTMYELFLKTFFDILTICWNFIRNLVIEKKFTI